MRIGEDYITPSRAQPREIPGQPCLHEEARLEDCVRSGISADPFRDLFVPQSHSLVSLGPDNGSVTFEGILDRDQRHRSSGVLITQLQWKSE